VLSGSVLLARSLTEEHAEDLTALVTEAAARLSVPVVAVLSDGQRAIRDAVQTALPCVPHYLGGPTPSLEVRYRARYT
jgi:hypothetical protein